MFKNIRQSDRRFLLAMFIAHAAFFLLALHYKRIYNGDSAEYIYMALNIKTSGWFYSGNPVLPVNIDYLTLRPPGYPLFLLGVYAFAVNNWLVLVLQNIISVFNTWMLRDTIQRLGYNTKYDWLLILFIVVYPSQFINADLIAPDILLQLFVLFYFRYFIALVLDRKTGNAYIMTAALIAGLFVKPVLYPFVYIHIIVLMVAAVRSRLKFAKLVAAMLLPVLAVNLYSGWNYQRTGKYHFSSIQSFNAIFYYQYFFSAREDEQAGKLFLEQERNKIAALADFPRQYDYANKRGLQLLKDNAAAYIPFHVKHSAKLLIDPGKGELDMFTNRLTLDILYRHRTKSFYEVLKQGDMTELKRYIADNPVFFIAIGILLFNIFRLAGLVYFLQHKKTAPVIRLFIGGSVAYFILLTGPIGSPRYFIPVSLIAIGCAVMGFQFYKERNNEKEMLLV